MDAKVENLIIVVKRAITLLSDVGAYETYYPKTISDELKACMDRIESVDFVKRLLRIKGILESSTRMLELEHISGKNKNALLEAIDCYVNTHLDKD